MMNKGTLNEIAKADMPEGDEDIWLLHDGLQGEKKSSAVIMLQISLFVLKSGKLNRIVLCFC
jgi:hypothetical protein